jgi:acyl carrier protein
MKLILAIEESLDVQFSDEELISIKNVGDLLSRVEAKK